MGHKYLEGTVRTTELQTDKNIEIFIYHTWFISSLLKILHGLPALPVEHMAWPSHVYTSLQHCPIEYPLPLHLPPLSPAFPLLSGFMVTCPARLRLSLYPLRCFGLNALSLLLNGTHHHLELFQWFGFCLFPLWNKLHKVKTTSLLFSILSSGFIMIPGW